MLSTIVMQNGGGGFPSSNGTGSFSQRRQATSSLPSFNLPSFSAPFDQQSQPSHQAQQQQTPHLHHQAPLHTPPPYVNHTLPSTHETHQASLSPGTHSQAPSSAPPHLESYTHARPPSAASWYATTTTSPQNGNFAYAPQQPRTQHVSSTSGPERLFANQTQPSQSPQPLHHSQHSQHAQPQPPQHPQGPMPSLSSYRAFSAYPSMIGMPGPVLSNIHQPGGQMSMIPPPMGGIGPGFGHPMMYGQFPQQPVDRPFKCSQCTQSFSRNHDLKRHTRIHLAVKPFPCNHCSRSFSRKDALKRHRLVKGCEKNGHSPGSQGEEMNGDSNNSRRNNRNNRSTHGNHSGNDGNSNGRE